MEQTGEIHPQVEQRRAPRWVRDPERGWVLRWVGSETSRAALGYPETARRLERLLPGVDPSNRAAVEARLDQARRGEGPTLFDEIVAIIRQHGPGGRESTDGILLEPS